MSDIRVTLEDPTGETAAALIKELSTELAALYPTSHGGDGSGAFKPQDVTVPRAAFIVLWRGDEPLGCGALRPMEEAHVVEVKRMFVRPTARGQGLSRRILTELEKLAREFGYQVVRLETGTRQTEAIGLYESAGYAPIDCYGIYADEPLSVCYEKLL
jgi:putative acetyltransferase